ncbi:MAG: hypothetical protein ABSH42_06080 [Bryobacteraceae bacterium]|jgi:hypothetical protein
MRFYYRFLGIALLIFVPGVTTRAQDSADSASVDYSITFVFGPGFAATARQGAHAAASASRHWFGTTRATVELWRAGSPDAQRIDPKMNPKEMDEAFADTALLARTADPAAFLTSLDAAAQATALRPGIRLVVAVLNTPPLSGDMELAIKNLVGVCKTNSVRVAVLDIVEPGAKVVPSALRLLTNNTGGAWVTQAGNLEASLLAVTHSAKAEALAAARVDKAEALPPVASTPQAAPAAAGPPAPTTAGAAQNEIPVRARFIRTSSTGGSSNSGIESVVSGGSGGRGVGAATGIQMNERSGDASDSTGPMLGLIVVESPLSALKFQVDDSAGTYLARARIIAIVRNSKGAAVWSGQKDVEIHGPVRDMNLRQKGNLEFMRGVTIPGHDHFTIDAKVEDLLAGTSGRIQTPLRGGQGAPGLMASDVLFVRPFKRSTDKFEADQVFAYEGEALSPVLDPVFQAGEQFDLQLYLILYPDIHGAQPDMNLELSREGHVVIRMPMQFKTAILNTDQDATSKTGSALTGGHAHAFPYLADVKGAKLAAGNYDAIVTIRQGKSVITRDVPFRVVGERGATEAAAPEKTLIKRTEAEDGVVVLPEIEPATIDSSGLGMSQDEQKRLWDEAAANAKEYSAHLPNFRCAQETHRFTGPASKPDELKEANSFRDELTFEDGRETYRVVEIDGNKTEASRQDLNFVNSKGEFGSMLMGLFDPEVGATYKWAGRAMAMGVLCQVFEVAVPRARSNFTLTFNRMGEPAGYTGKVFVDDETGMVRRLTIQGDSLPPTFPLQSPSFALEYGMVRIGTVDYLLPLRSTMQVRRGKVVERNESVFREYRRFEASSGIKFDNK